MGTTRHLGAVLLAMAAGLFAGCLPEVRRGAVPAPVPAPASAPVAPGATPELVCLDVAFVERPLGNDLLDAELWQAGNESAVGLETLSALEEDGLRVCRLGGTLPPALQALLDSRATCSGPRRLRDELGKAMKLPVGPPRPSLAFSVEGPDGQRRVTLSQAQCLFRVQPRPSDENGVILRIVPGVKHGVSRTRARVEATPEGSLRWALEPGQAFDEFAHLAFEVAVAPGEFVVVGPRLERKGRLGTVWFCGDGRHRLLILRAGLVPTSQREELVGPVAPLAHKKGQPITGGIARRMGFSY